MNDIVEVPDQQQLKTIGHISYFMHAVVAVGAVLPGVQASVLLLLIAFFIDMVKRDDAAEDAARISLGHRPVLRSASASACSTTGSASRARCGKGTRSR